MSRSVARLLLVAALLMLASSVTGCGDDSAGSSGGTTPKASVKTDSSLQAWPKAEAAMKKVAADAVLLGVGTGGLALADVPSSWNFTFFSPAKNELYSVSVEHGKVQAPREMGQAKPGTEVRPVTEIGSIKMGAADAVVKAREYGEKSGTVPKNVLVSGSFAEIPGGAAFGIKTGVWTVTFASGTDMADAVKLEVDMMSGAVKAGEK